MTVAVLTSHRTVQGAPLKSARERMDIISAYQQVGSYRGAAALSGTTAKTVKRVIALHPPPGHGPSLHSCAPSLSVAMRKSPCVARSRSPLVAR